MSQIPTKHRRQWRSVEDLTRPEAAPGLAQGEFAEGAAELEVDGVTRRQFMGLMGASAALAGGGTLAGCVRKPVERIMPFAKRPEDRIPGKPVYYATAFQLGTAVQGVLVESHDGRPTKVEGNPQHPASKGAASVWAQASVLGLYDPDRSKAPRKAGAIVGWEEAWKGVDQVLAAARQGGMRGLAVVVPTVASPTFRAMLKAFQEAHPGTRIVVSDPLWPAAARAAAAWVAGPRAVAVPSLEGAQVIASFDADVLGVEADAVRHAKAFAAGRRLAKPGDPMNRLYAVGPVLDTTAAMADHRLRVKPSEVRTVLAALALSLADKQGVALPAGADDVRAALGAPALDEKGQRFVDALAKDLASRRGKALVLVGARQPAAVQALGHLVNTMLGADGGLVTWSVDADLPALGDLASLAADLKSKACDTVVVLGANPALDAPADLGLPALLEAATVVHAGLYVDETARLADWHLPASHDLEAWGDARSSDGTVSVVQPLIAPLYDTPSLLEVGARLVEGKPITGYDTVRGYWSSVLPGGLDEAAWRRWLHRGTVDAPAAATPATPSYAGLGARLGQPAAASGTELVFLLDGKILDGRFANNGWLQELPDAMSKLTWDNAALVSPKTAGKLGSESERMVTVTLGGASVTLPLLVTPGVAEDTVVLPLGYGRSGLGHVSEGVGFAVEGLRTSAGYWMAAGASVAAAAGHHELATTQHHHTMDPGFGFPERPLVRESTAEGWKADPDFVLKSEIIPKKAFDKLEKGESVSLSPEPALTGAQQWGLSIDLSSCIGCNACTVACNAENNIPVVGKERVLKGREMHWIRLDRYYTGDDPDDPEAVFEPLPCQQCENAPCEIVCPVAATTHSPEGLNDMAYNRCIGTRYCSNNCPFKVRRFNFFNYNLDRDPVGWMGRNPDVTVRFRGVMEKCTYCVQRINEAKIEAKVRGDGHVPDGAIVTACQQTCPTDAIVFGDVKDPSTRVSRAKAQSRDYALLAELNIRPRTTYLAKIRNPNPELV